MEADVTRLGLVAGRGRYPLVLAQAAKEHGVEHLAVVAMHGETDAAVADLADAVDWVYVGQIGRAIRALLRQDVRHVLFAGQIRPGRLFKGLRPDLRAVRLLASLTERNAATIFSAVADEFERDGVTVLPATTFVEDCLAAPGVMGSRRPSEQQRADIAFGAHIARAVSRLDIGQTVVVKQGTVLAVEGFEGTDKAILRGGELGGGSGAVVVKVAKEGHDMRFDVPCIGLGTVDSLREAGASVLAVEAGRTLLIDKCRLLEEMDAAGIIMYGISADQA